MAKGRRAAGEGTLYKAADGYWNCIIELPRGADGKRQRKRIRAKTQKAVLAKRDEAMRVLVLGTTATAQQTLAQYFVTWIDTSVKPTLKASTVVDYERMIRLYIAPHIGHITVANLSAAHVQQCINTLVTAELSPRTIRKAKAIISAALDRAVKWEDLTRNVAKLVTIPSVDHYHARFLHANEAQQLLDVVEVPEQIGIVLGLLLGFRRGEVLGLRWADVDYGANLIHVRGTLKNLDGKLLIDTPKTERSARSVPMPALVRTALEHQWEYLQAARRDPAWHEHGVVLPRENGNLMSPNHFIVYVFKPALERAGLPKEIRFHDLRHSCAALLIATGTPINVVQSILGHTSIATTSDLYGHIYDELPRAALDTMTERMHKKA